MQVSNTEVCSVPDCRNVGLTSQWDSDTLTRQHECLDHLGYFKSRKADRKDIDAIIRYIDAAENQKLKEKLQKKLAYID